jgi:hypothetical protein
MLNEKQFRGQPLHRADLNPVSRASVPARGSGISSKADYLKTTDWMGKKMAEGKAELRAGGIYHYADAGVRLYGSSSKQRRAAAKLAGKLPVNKRKPR